MPFARFWASRRLNHRAAAVARFRPCELALAMLLIGAMRNYAYDVFPPELRGIAYKALGSLAMLALVGLVYALRPSRVLGFVCLWWAFEELQSVICSVAYMIEPWAVPVGTSICSARIGFDLGAAGIMVVAALLWKVAQVSTLTGVRNGQGAENE